MLIEHKVGSLYVCLKRQHTLRAPTQPILARPSYIPSRSCAMPLRREPRPKRPEESDYFQTLRHHLPVLSADAKNSQLLRYSSPWQDAAGAPSLSTKLLKLHRMPHLRNVRDGHEGSREDGLRAKEPDGSGGAARGAG